MSNILAIFGRNSLTISRSTVNSSRHVYRPISQRSSLNSIVSSNPSSERRTYFSDASLGLDKLEAARTSVQRVFETGKDRYIARIQDFIEKGDSKSMFKDDLINLLGLADEEHLDLIERFVKTAATEQDSSFGGWGTSLMRLYLKYNQVDRAYNAVMDDSFGTFFHQRSSYQIAMTMLYRSGRYQEVLDVYDRSRKVLKRENDRFTTDRRISVIAFAALAKINTPEAQAKAEAMFHEDSKNPNLQTRVISLVAYLSINQGKPALALNLISDMHRRSYTSSRELKTKALVDLKRYDDVLMHLRHSLKDAKPGQKVILQKNFELIQGVADEIDPQTKSELSQLLDELQKTQLVDTEAGIEDIIFNPIEPRERTLHFRTQNNENQRKSGFWRKFNELAPEQ